MEQRVHEDHPLRKIRNLIDFSFIRSEVKELYGYNGNQSIDPAVILKLMFLLFYENVKSERALAYQLLARLDWLWFCDYDIDDKTPNHSVISKARTRWGIDVFIKFFQNILQQCLDANLIDGEITHIDSSTLKANASKDKIIPKLKLILEDLYNQLDKNTEDENETHQKVSKTDPDAGFGKRKDHLRFSAIRITELLTTNMALSQLQSPQQLMSEMIKFLSRLLRKVFPIPN